MNFIRFVPSFIGILTSISLFSQPVPIEPYRIEICNNKTTHIIFPFPIKSVDRGSLDVLAQKSPGADAVLQLKADHPRIAPTNVTVITSDNKLYSFLVVYDSMPLRLTLSFDSARITRSENSPENRNSFIFNGSERPDAGTLQATAILAANKKRKRLPLQDSHERMLTRLTGIYIKNDVYYFAFKVSNESNVSFSLESISFTIKDTKKVKRKASQEKALLPLFEYGMQDPVKAHGQKTWVVAVAKFTLEDNKYLDIQMIEQDGGRNLSLRVQNKHLLAAKGL